MPGPKKHSSTKERIEHQKRLARLEKMMLRGVTNQTEMAAAFGVDRNRIRVWIDEIEQEWLNADRQDVILERTVRIRQIEALAQESLNAWQRSKQDEETVTISQAVCPGCRGTKKQGPMDNKQPCPVCDATGRVTVESVKVGGQTGDPRFLAFAKECFVECARLKGVYPGGNARVGALVKTAQAVGGDAQVKIEELYVEAPAEVIINALAVMEELREKVAEKERAAAKLEQKPQDIVVSDYTVGEQESDSGPTKPPDAE